MQLKSQKEQRWAQNAARKRHQDASEQEHTIKDVELLVGGVPGGTRQVRYQPNRSGSFDGFVNALIHLVNTEVIYDYYLLVRKPMGENYADDLDAIITLKPVPPSG